MISLRSFPTRALAIPVAALMLIMTGCGGSGSARKAHPEFSKYDNEPYADTFSFAASPERTHRAVVEALQRRGAVISVSDSRSGLVTANLHSDGLLPEEEYDQQPVESEEPSAGSVLAAIFGVILFILLLGWLSDGCSTDSSSDSERTRTREREPQYEPPPPPEPAPPVSAANYVVSCTLTPEADSTSVRFAVVRQTIMNGTVTGSTPIQNKYVNYWLRDAILAQLH